jgi:hypothetical protein
MWSAFTVRYELSPYITQVCLVFKGLNSTGPTYDAHYRQTLNSVHWADHDSYHYNLVCKKLEV